MGLWGSTGLFANATDQGCDVGFATLWVDLIPGTNVKFSQYFLQPALTTLFPCLHQPDPNPQPPTPPHLQWGTEVV